MFFFGCKNSIVKENELFENYIENIDQNIALEEYDGVLIIPINRCSSCVSVAANFASDSYLDLDNLLIIVNEIRTVKELDIRFQLKPTNNVIFDTSDIFGKSQLDFGNVGFYLMRNGEIYQKEIVNSSNVSSSLES